MGNVLRHIFRRVSSLCRTARPSACLYPVGPTADIKASVSLCRSVSGSFATLSVTAPQLPKVEKKTRPQPARQPVAFSEDGAVLESPGSQLQGPDGAPSTSKHTTQILDERQHHIKASLIPLYAWPPLTDLKFAGDYGTD